jgi:MraZ protein
MFLGEYKHTLDSKARLTIPARYRADLESGLIVTRHPTDPCLMLFPGNEWERVAEKINALPLADPKATLLRRLLFGAAENLEQDKQGRIILSQRLREYASIESDVLVLGMSKFVELWAPNTYEAKVAAQLNSGELSADLFAAFDI